MVRRNQEVGQNVPPPPLDNNNVRQSDRVESVQVAPQSVDRLKEDSKLIDEFFISSYNANRCISFEMNEF
jgi:hypothetical protein